MLHHGSRVDSGRHASSTRGDISAGLSWPRVSCSLGPAGAGCPIWRPRLRSPARQQMAPHYETSIFLLASPWNRHGNCLGIDAFCIRFTGYGLLCYTGPCWKLLFESSTFEWVTKKRPIHFVAASFCKESTRDVRSAEQLWVEAHNRHNGCTRRNLSKPDLMLERALCCTASDVSGTPAGTSCNLFARGLPLVSWRGPDTSKFFYQRLSTSLFLGYLACNCIYTCQEFMDRESIKYESSWRDIFST